ncbi:hypothetical protein PoB_003715600 [Plakobranchus ocellatus]|uniref:Apple domain-containing protein n=1 Tax=Plakobranchus ocellatus TaxID=259542 RepID=A0AAV4AVS1_9GAST|nr:hypothetical protein PoB_003715600 [Plakobranchus ocellatus]
MAPMSRFVAHALLAALLVSLEGSSEAISREMDFTACPQGGAIDDEVIEISHVPSVLSCAFRCLTSELCISFNIWPDSQLKSSKYLCELSPFVLSCEDLASNPEVTYYYMKISEVEVNPTEEAVVELQDDSFRAVLQTDHTGILNGSVAELYQEVAEGAKVRVLVEDISGSSASQLYNLDCVNATVDGSVVVGTAYTYHSDVIGQSTWVKVDVSTSSELTELRTNVSGFFQIQATMKITWFIRSVPHFYEDGPSVMFTTVLHVVTKFEDVLLSYRLYSITALQSSHLGLGIYIPGKEAGVMMLSLREIDMGSEHTTERVANIDSFTGYGEGFETDTTVIDNIISPDFCFYFVLDALSTNGEGSLSDIMESLQNGARIVVSYVCYDADSMDYKSYTEEAERVKFTSKLYGKPLVKVFVKGEAIYKEPTLHFRVFTFDSQGTVQMNGHNQSCSAVYFFADNRTRAGRFSVNKNGTVLEGFKTQVLDWMHSGKMPRLMMQTKIDTFEYFDIEFAEIKRNYDLWLRSYRYAIEQSPGFSVFTFDVWSCRYSLEENALIETINQPVLSNTALKMTLYFEI